MEVDELGMPILEMANLGSRLTGLPKLIHIWSQGEQREIGHGPRVKVSFLHDRFDSKQNVSISISDNPIVVAPKNFQFSSDFTQKEFELIRAWILERKDKLLRYWVDPTMSVDDILE